MKGLKGLVMFIGALWALVAAIYASPKQYEGHSLPKFQSCGCSCSSSSSSSGNE